jgi:hypothetical protein
VGGDPRAGRAARLPRRTDHLHDAELYGVLWRDILPDEMHALDDDPTRPGTSILGGWSNEDIQAHLKYYADEKERQRWVRDFPEQPAAAAGGPPYDRDRHLPQRSDLADGVVLPGDGRPQVAEGSASALGP